MRHLLAFIAIVTVAFNLSATHQEPDTIYIDGEKWALEARPITSNADFFEKVNAMIPEPRIETTCNWAGFVGFWSLDNERQLRLDSISITTGVSEKGHKKTTTLARYSERPLIASWYSDTVVAGKNDYIDIYRFYYNDEKRLIIDKGKVVKEETFHNKLLCDGYTLYDIYYDEDRGLKLKGYDKYLLNRNDYPELEGERITMLIYITVDELGSPLSVNIHVHSRNQDNPTINAGISKLKNDLQSFFMSIKPWKTLLIQGEPTPHWGSASVPYRFF